MVIRCLWAKYMCATKEAAPLANDDEWEVHQPSQRELPRILLKDNNFEEKGEYPIFHALGCTSL